jgi:hypothetical protein
MRGIKLPTDATKTVQIQKVTPLRPNRAKVRVHMREKAHVVAAGRKEDAYERNVDVEYYLLRCNSGWKMIGSQDVTQPTVV